jgi:hypothetical protein
VVRRPAAQERSLARAPGVIGIPGRRPRTRHARGEQHAGDGAGTAIDFDGRFVPVVQRRERINIPFKLSRLAPQRIGARQARRLLDFRIECRTATGALSRRPSRAISGRRRKFAPARRRLAAVGNRPLSGG